MSTNQNTGTIKKGKIIVFSAASGAGKTTILNYLKQVMPDLVYSISATTRRPRAHEKDGVHYFFLSEKEFNRRISNSEFAEWAIVHDNYYGTPKAFINQTIQSGKHIIMDIDVYGKIKFDQTYPDATGIFISPPSEEELERRLRGRGTDAEDVITVRLSNAKKETEFARKNGKYRYTIVNDDLKRARQEAVSLIKKIIAE